MNTVEDIINLIERDLYMMEILEVVSKLELKARASYVIRCGIEFISA